MANTVLERRQAAVDKRNASPVKMAHVVLASSRYEAMIDWYKTVLLAKIAFANGFLTFMTYDDEHHRVAIGNVPGLKDRPEGTAGVNHIAFTFATLGDLLSTYVRLKELGILPFWPINHGATVSLYYHDPDKNSIELQVDAFAPADLIDDFLDFGDFAVNPIGVEFDPDALLQRYLAGESLADLMRRPKIGARIDPTPRPASDWAALIAENQ